MRDSIKKVWFDNDRIWVNTSKGELLSQPFEIYPELFFAAPVEREDYYFYDNGSALRWDKIDLDVCIEDLNENLTHNYDNKVNHLLSQFPYIDMKAVAELTGMHWTKLARYKFGVWEPSDEEYESLKATLRTIGKELAAV